MSRVDSTDHDGGGGNDGSAARFGLPGYDAQTYGDSFADVYDRWYADLDDEDFVIAVCAHLPERSARILELGVGTGRLAAQVLAGRPGAGDALVGVDSSRRMLVHARRRLGPAITLVAADFSAVLPDGPFDCIYVGYNTLFNLPDDAALASCLAMVGARLSPDGSFFTDVTCPATESGDAIEGDTVTVRSVRAGETVLNSSRHDPANQRIVGRFVHHLDDRNVRVRPWTVRYWHPDQLDRAARAAGLELVSRLTDGLDTTHDGFDQLGRARGGRSISRYRVATANLRGQ